MKRLWTAVLLLGVLGCSQQGNESTAFSSFVDQYLDEFAKRHPSIASGNGMHWHDDMLEDFSAPAIREEIAALERDSAALSRFNPRDLSQDERVDRHVLLGIIDGWLLEQVVVLVQTVSSRDGWVAPREVSEIAIHESSEPRRLRCRRPATRSHQGKAGRGERGTQDARARRHPKRQEESFSREAGKKRRHECSAATGLGKTLRLRRQRPNLSGQCAAHSCAAAFSSALLS